MSAQPKHSLAGALSGLQRSRGSSAPAQEDKVRNIAQSFARVPEYPSTRDAKAGDGALRDHPDFTQMKVYVRKETKRAVQARLLNDPAGSNLSELVELLLKKYLGA